MRLVACGVVAMSNTAESAARNREMHENYRSASCDDVAAAVDREMALRAEVEALRADAERYRYLRAKHVVESLNDGELCIHYACDFEHYNDPDASIDAALAQAKEG